MQRLGSHRCWSVLCEINGSPLVLTTSFRATVQFRKYVVYLGQEYGPWFPAHCCVIVLNGVGGLHLHSTSELGFNDFSSNRPFHEFHTEATNSRQLSWVPETIQACFSLTKVGLPDWGEYPEAICNTYASEILWTDGNPGHIFLVSMSF